MNHYLLELAIWLLGAFFVGCVIGTLLRRMFGKPVAAVAATEGAEAQTAASAANTLHETEPLPGHAPMAPRWTMQPDADETAPDEAEQQPQSTLAGAVSLEEQPDAAPRMPVGISGPRDGRPDALQRISGVGPRNEQILHSLGFYHFEQIAQWTEQHVDWVDGYLRFNGRIRREGWVEQSRLLAAGEEDEFHRLFGTGGMRDADGQSAAGGRTRHS